MGGPRLQWVKPIGHGHPWNDGRATHLALKILWWVETQSPMIILDRTVAEERLGLPGNSVAPVIPDGRPHYRETTARASRLSLSESLSGSLEVQRSATLRLPCDSDLSGLWQRNFSSFRSPLPHISQ